MALSGAMRGTGKKRGRKRSNAVRVAPNNYVDILGNELDNVISPTFPPPVAQFSNTPAADNVARPAAPLQNVGFNRMHLPQNHQQSNSFCLKWVYNTTISKCYGCNQPIPNPSRDHTEALVVVYRDYRSFFLNGVLRWTSNPENIHFHLNRGCVQLRYPNFLTNTLVIPEEFVPHLDMQQKLILLNEFGINAM